MAQEKMTQHLVVQDSPGWAGREAATQRVKANLIAMKLQRKRRGCRDRDLCVPELLGMKKEKRLEMWPRKQNEGPTFFFSLV